MKTSLRSAAGLLMLGAVLTACGGTAAATSPGGTTHASSGPHPTTAARSTAAATQANAAIDACALVTRPEATALLGSDPGAGVAAGTADAPACAYDGSLTIGVDPVGGKALFDSRNATVASRINGVGDAAAYTLVGNTVAAMDILKGSVVVSVNVQGNPSLQSVTLAALTALGKTIAGRI